MAEQIDTATEDQLKTDIAGTLKGRLVTKDLKAINKLPEALTFAGVIELTAVRLILAATDAFKHRVSTTDFDTAYSQTPEDDRKDWILNKRMCPYLNKRVYELCTGNIYGKQVGG